MLWWSRNILGQLAAAMPQAVTVTPEEREAIQRVHFFYNSTYLEFFIKHFSVTSINFAFIILSILVFCSKLNKLDG